MFTTEADPKTGKSLTSARPALAPADSRPPTVITWTTETTNQASDVAAGNAFLHFIPAPPAGDPSTVSATEITQALQAWSHVANKDRVSNGMRSVRLVALRLIMIAGLIGSVTPANAQQGCTNAPYIGSCISNCGYHPDPNREACVSSCRSACVRPRPSSPAAPPVATPSHTWGSIYVAPPPTGGSGYGLGYADAQGAQHTAMQECFGDANMQCIPVITFPDQCGALVEAQRGSEVLNVYGYAAQRKDTARERALAKCQSAHTANECSVIFSFCSYDK
jgi:hypothetical protein